MKDINRNAPVACEKSIVIPGTPEEVWKLLSNIDQWSQWQKDISSSRLNGSLEPGTTFDWKSGATKIRSVLHTANINKELGWSGRTVGIYAIHNWVLSEKNGSTLLIVSESMEGVLAAIFSKKLNQTLDKGLDMWLKSLKEATGR